MTVLPLALKVPIVLSIQNVETWRESRSAAAGLGASIERWKLRGFEARAFARAAVCCPTSALEGEQVKRLAPGARVHIVPNGVDTAAFVPAAAAAQGGVPALVFTGTLSYAPNAEGIIWFVRQVWSLIQAQVPGARLEIVGREPPAEVAALASDQIRVCGDVPDVLPFLHAAWAAIVPLLHGGGTRLKILEAMACALPIVSTTIGAEGLDAVPERDILIADDAPAFAAQVICLLRDPARRVQLGKAGRALIERHYDWNVIAERLDAAYQMAAAARGHA